MFLLAVALWAIFLRPVKATMPRIYVFRAIVLALVSICCGAFWLFYVVQVTEGKSIKNINVYMIVYFHSQFFISYILPILV